MWSSTKYVVENHNEKDNVILWITTMLVATCLDTYIICVFQAMWKTTSLLIKRCGIIVVVYLHNFLQYIM